ncbi:MAG: nucleotidyltransferase family protein, partial [Gemmatimonadota bacterium]
MPRGPDDSDRTAAAQALQTLLRGAPAAATVPALTRLQWEQLRSEAARHHVLPMLYRRLERPEVRNAVPTDVLDSMRETFLVVAFRTTRLLRHTAGAVKLLEENGIRTMVLKGVHLAAAVYPEAAFRGMADADILIDRQNLARADALFVERGWGPLPRPDIERFCEKSNHLAKLHEPDGITLEIHYHIERPTSPFRIPVEALWETAVPVDLEGVRTLGLAPEELVIHLCIHASYHHRYSRAPLKGLLDVRAVLVRNADAIDWPRLCRLATEWGVARFVYLTLRLVEEVLGARIDTRDFDGLEHDTFDEALIDVARDYITTPFEDLPEAYEILAESGRLRSRLRLVARS